MGFSRTDFINRNKINKELERINRRNRIRRNITKIVKAPFKLMSFIWGLL